ncbi:MAG: hypothetical protein ABGZ53_32275 [Fuerstiella sp.]
MSSLNQWDMLLEFCLHHELLILPSLISDGEPWCHLKTIARLTGDKESTVRNKANDFDLEKHPSFSNFIHLSDFEKVKTPKKPVPKAPVRKRNAKNKKA